MVEWGGEVGGVGGLMGAREGERYYGVICLRSTITKFEMGGLHTGLFIVHRWRLINV